MSASFARALLDPWATVPGLRTWNGSDPSVRLDVYRNNVVSSLVEALADTFPVVHAVVGDAAFRTLAASHVRAHPPRSPVLAHYGGGFAAWLADAEALAAQPWLPDLARLEFARVQAFHAPEAQALEAGALASWLARPDALPGLVLHLHPSVQVLASAWAVVSLWAAHQGPGPATPPSMAEPEAALVMRAGDDAVVVPVPPAMARWVARLRQGRPLGPVVTDLVEAGDTLDLGASLGLLLRLGALTGATATTGDPDT
jgi:hypothetical protein